MAADPLLRFRPEFPMLEKTTYLISNSLGAMPRAAAQALAEYAEIWATRGVRAWADSWWDLSVTAGDGIAPLIGAPAGTVSMLPNVTIASAVLLSSLEYGSVGGVLKWLCGGPGGAFLYVRPELRRQLTPALTGWFAHPAPFEFEPPPMRWRDDAFRFLLGTPPIPALYVAREGPRIVQEAGTDAIRAKSLRQTGRLIELAEERGFRCATPRDPARRGGTAVADFDNALEVSRALNARDIVVDFRSGVGIRLSPHFYTADSELDKVFESIDEIRSTGSWRRWSGQPALVT
jgi:kynureninase